MAGSTNPLGQYGKPERMYLGKRLILKRPTERTAAKRILNPDDPEFIPPPIRAYEIWCPGCHKFKLPDLFHRSNTRPTGRQPYCKACRKAGKKHAPMFASTRWYRESK